jgi:hypothetical protein
MIDNPDLVLHTILTCTGAAPRAGAPGTVELSCPRRAQIRAPRTDSSADRCARRNARQRGASLAREGYRLG